MSKCHFNAGIKEVNRKEEVSIKYVEIYSYLPVKVRQRWSS